MFRKKTKYFYIDVCLAKLTPNCRGALNILVLPLQDKLPARNTIKIGRASPDA